MASYTIKKGDNLTKIAKKYGTTVSALVKSNNIKDKNLIITGRSLTVPSKNAGGTPQAVKRTSSPVKASAPSKPKSSAGMGGRAKASDKKTLGNIAGVGDSNASGTSFGNQMKAGKDYKAPKSYKPLSTGTKLGMAASVVPGGRAAVVGAKAVGSIARGGKAMQIVKGQKAIAKVARGKATRLQNAAEAAKQQKARSEAAKRAAATRAKNAKKKK